MKQYATNLKGMLIENKSPTEVFKRFGLDKAGDNVLLNPLFGPWLKYVEAFNKENPSKKFGLSAVLPNEMWHWEDMIALAMKNPRTKRYANIVEAERTKKWLSEGTLPKNIFVSLTGTKYGDNFFEEPGFRTWLKYLNNFNKMYPERRMNLIDSVRGYYTDKRLVEILVLGKSNPKTKVLATKLERTLLNTWSRELKSPDEVSTIMNVETSSSVMQRYRKRYDWAATEAGNQQFNNPKRFNDYLNYYKMRNPSVREQTISILRKRYSDEELIKMTANYKDIPGARQVEHDLFVAWKKTKQTPDDIFKLMQLKNTDDKLLESPLLSTWYMYVKHFTTTNVVEETMGTLTRSFGNERLSHILVAAKNVESTKQMAENMQKWQLTTWLRGREDPALVKTWMGVRESMKNPETLLFEKYVVLLKEGAKVFA
ncbi:hypothetical protein PHMEG_00025598 [Phytophthora megakarya]|uniref:RxLR effector PexRD54 WY domain-containing protein n=1 Tax=Phytophthora megakarya TaxID=4795 RepID=A0A225VCW3_9STRA|nr:hypothetical protein PHMEG_00025598 [Phytophthora megakarya]